MHRTFSKLAILGAAFVMTIGLTLLITGQPASKLTGQPTPKHHVGVVDDWSFHHLVFSDPGTYEQAVKSGASYAKWLTIRYDTRFIMQQMKREAAMKQGGTIAVNGFPSATGGSEDLAIGLLRQLPVGPIRLPLPPPKPMPPKPTSLKWDWSMNMGTGAKVGEARYPAKYSFNPIGAPDCAHDFVAFNTGLAGGASQPTIIAYKNLYPGASPGCGTTGVPAIYWRYNTAYPYRSGGGAAADGSKIVTSVVLSGDGSQVAFVESNSTPVASLVILKWAANSSLVQMNTGTNNVVPGNYRACAAPCMTRLTFGNSTDDTISSPFYDYTNDVIYVGDSNGYLHRFSGIFSGTPGETGSPWPEHISVCPLGSPVYDPVSLDVFSDSGMTTVCTGTDHFGGRFHHVPGGAGGGTVVDSATVANTGGPGWGDGPILDPAAARVYAFTNDDAGGHAGVFQFSTSFGVNDTGTEETLGQGSTTGYLYSGTFDNTYFTSSSGANPVGNLYVCGRASASQTPTLWRVPIGGTSSTLSAAVVGPALASGTTTCSPVNEFLNGTTDRIFVSVEANNVTGAPISCPSGTGCIMSFNVTNTTGWGTSKATSATALEAGGTSGIVIDNAASSTGASQVYFSPLSNQSCPTSGGTGGCAIQATQSALH